MSQGFLFSHGFPFELEPIGIVDDTVQDGVGEGRGGEPIMPVGHRDLGGQGGGSAFVAVVNDLQQVLGLGFGERVAQPVVDDEELGLGQDVQELRIRAFGMGQGQFLEQPRALKIADREPVAAGSLTQRTGEVGFPGAGRAGDDQVMFLPDPLALGQSQDLAAVQAPARSKVQVLDDGRFPEAGHPHSPGLFSLLTQAPLPVEQQPEALLEGQLPVLAAFHLLPQTLQHALKLQGR